MAWKDHIRPFGPWATMALVCTAGCGPRERAGTPELLYDFRERLPYAAVELGTDRVDMAEPEAAQALLNGWGARCRAPDGSWAAWTTSRIARVLFFLPQRRDITLALRMYPYVRAYADQKVTVLVNGRKAATLRLERGSEFGDYRVRVPRKLWRLGDNEIALKTRYISSRYRTGVCVSRIRLEELSPAPESESVRPETVAGGWRQQPGTRVAWNIVVPDGGRLCVQPSFGAAARVKLWRVQLRIQNRRIELCSGKTSPEQPILVPLAKVRTGTRAVLEFESFGTSAVTWRKAELEGHVDPRQANILLVTLDTLRADHVGAYGYARPTTPTLDRLAERGTLFLLAFANSTESAPSHASLLTGRYPQSHGLVSNGRRLDRQQTTLAEILSDRGWRTAAYVNFWLLSRPSGTGKGFGVRRVVVGAPPEPGLGHSRRNVFAQAAGWIARHRHEKFFLWVHSQFVHMDAAIPSSYVALFWTPPEDAAAGRYFPVLSPQGRDALRLAYNTGQTDLTPEELEAVQAYYDACLRFTDDCLMAFLEALRRHGLDPFTAVVVTSDHGVSLGERHAIRHTGPPYEHLLRVPLIVLLPGSGQKAGGRVEGQVELVDVAPTLLSYVGVPPPRRMQGMDLLPVLRDPSLGTKPYSYATVKNQGFWYSVRSGAARYILDTSGEDYFSRDFSDREIRSQGDEYPEEREALKKILLHWVKHTPDVTAQTEGDVPPQVLEMLRKAGYLDGRQ